MRVKVGDHWYSPEQGQPIAVELTANDRRNIAAMSPDATRYGVWPGRNSSDEAREWLGR